MAQMAAMLNDIGNGTSDRVLKSMDANRYATKKTIAQGMLDIALLTANASQLKYILQVGHKHEFYTLMLTLISISIILQMSVGILFVVIGGLNINRRKDQRAAIIINDIILVAIFVISLVNVTAAILAVVMSLIDLEKGPRQREIANTLNHISLAFVLIALSCDVIKMNFGLDPAVRTSF